jgi:type IV pilus assembly protein PilB
LQFCDEEVFLSMTAFKKVTNKLVGELLIDSGVITRSQLTQALSRKKETGKLLGEVLVELGFASEEDVAAVVAAQYRIPYLPLKHHDVDKELLKLIPRSLATKYRCFPVDKISTVLTVAMENPLDEKAVEEIHGITGSRILCYVSTPSEILAAIEQHYGAAEADSVPSEQPEPAVPGGPAAPEPVLEGGIKVFQLEENGLSEG